MPVRLRIGAALAALALPAVALGQSPAASAAPPPPQPGGATPTPPGPAAPSQPQGYGYGDTPRRSDGTAAPRRHISHASGPIATLPGFEMLPDGGSRLFVELTQNVPVEEKKAAGTITYVIRGAHVTKTNNENALVTVHFNTPVTRARLLPAGRDLHFIVDLRRDAVPTWKLAPAKDGTAILQIEFAKGEFLPTNGDDPAAAAPSPKPAKKAPARKPTT